MLKKPAFAGFFYDDPKLKQKSLPDWAKWVAMDEDGSWWCYEVEPHQHDHGWYENEVGRNFKLSLPYQSCNNWRNSLIALD